MRHSNNTPVRRPDRYYTACLKEIFIDDPEMTEQDAYSHATDNMVIAIRDIIMPAHRHYILKCGAKSVPAGINIDALVNVCVRKQTDAKVHAEAVFDAVIQLENACSHTITHTADPHIVGCTADLHAEITPVVAIVNTMKTMTDYYALTGGKTI